MTDATKTATRRIYKYPLKVEPWQQVEMPAGSKILFVGDQRGTPTLWADVDTANDTSATRCFAIIGTGHSVPDKAEYIGTANCGEFVWHVYEIANALDGDEHGGYPDMDASSADERDELLQRELREAGR